MVIQYTAKVVAVSIASRDKASARLAGKLALVSSKLSETRLVMRFVGLLPILKWMQALFYTSQANRNPLLVLIERIQALSMLLYYPLEHAAYLGTLGIVNLKPRTVQRMSILSVRCWAVYVFLQLGHLAEEYRTLGRAEGEQAMDAAAVSKRKQAMVDDTIVNLAYAPLTVHWLVVLLTPERDRC